LAQFMITRLFDYHELLDDQENKFYLKQYLFPLVERQVKAFVRANDAEYPPGKRDKQRIARFKTNVCGDLPRSAIKIVSEPGGGVQSGHCDYPPRHGLSAIIAFGYGSAMMLFLDPIVWGGILYQD